MEWVVVAAAAVILVARDAAHGFNLSPNYSHVLQGPPDALFGFSVALWKDSNGKKRMVVGAPRGKNSSEGEGVLPLGSVHYCSLHDGGNCTTLQSMPMFESGFKDSLMDQYNYTMQTFGLGMGQTLATEKTAETSHLVACAPRYPKLTPTQIGNDGDCFYLKSPQDEPKALYKRNNNAFDSSLLGFSATLYNDTLVTGCPASLYGNGLVYVQVLIQRGRKYVSKLGRPNMSHDMLKNSDANEGWALAIGKFDGKTDRVAASSPKQGSYTGMVAFYPINMKPWMEPLQTISGTEIGAWFGYALASCDLNADGATDLIVGAPLSRHTEPSDRGKVFIYYAPLINDIPSDPDILEGSDPWGRFGTSLTSLDLDLDGYDDIAVGAPNKLEEYGAVYIYNGGPEGIRNMRNPQRITMSRFAPGMRGFGFSLDGGLDMDSNMYPDLLVGAVESDAAILIRSAPVIRLQGKFSFESPTIIVENNRHDIDRPRYIKMRAVCFDINIDFVYKTDFKPKTLDLRYEMHLTSNNASNYGFLQTISHSASSVKRTYERHLPWSLTVFVERSRSNINLTLEALLKVSIQSASFESEGDPPQVPPVMDIFTPVTFHSSTILTCEDILTCFSQPDLAVTGFGPNIVLGEGDKTVAVTVAVEVKNDPAYSVKVNVGHLETLNYNRVDGDTVIPECSSGNLVNQVAERLTCQFDEVEADETIKFVVYFTYDPVTILHYLKGKATPSLPFSLSVSSDVKAENNMKDNWHEFEVNVTTRTDLYIKAFADPESYTVMVNKSATAEDLKAVQTSPDTAFPVSDLGPHLVHDFSLVNRGPSPVRHAQMVFHIPLYRKKDHLTYFMDQPTTSQGVVCTQVPINPLGLKPPRVRTVATNASTTTIITTTTASNNIQPDSRRRRQIRAANDLHSKHTTDDYTYTHDTTDHDYTYTTDHDYTYTHDMHTTSEMTQTQWSSYEPQELTTYDPVNSEFAEIKREKNILECNSDVCEVRCEVGLIQVNEEVAVTFSSYLVTATANKVQLRRLQVRSWVRAIVPQEGSTVINPRLPATTEIYMIRPPETGLSALPFWVLIVAILAALLLILIMILVLYKLGFFKRKKPPSAAERRSMMAEQEANNVTRGSVRNGDM